MKTAMQELIDELKDYKRTTFSDKLVITFWIVKAEKLLEKEKEQIMNAHINGQSEFDVLNFTEFNKNLAEEYYNQTYNQNK